MEYLLVFLLIYFIPTIVAFQKKKRNAGAIATLNIFLGWTFIGWLVALIWSVTNDK